MKLPVSDFEDQIVNSVLEHKYTLINSEAGAGKSTLVPQYLMKKFSKVIITNPRVISAITLAQHVSNEMGVELGGVVGYRTGYYKSTSKDTRIEYCTDGLQLVRAIFNEDKQTEKVLVIDEVHEWTQQTETLVAWCKLMENNWRTKVVIMSATMETDKIAAYLGKDTGIVNIPGSTYHVEVEIRDKWDLIRTIQEEIYYKHNSLVIVPTKKEVQRVMEQLVRENVEILPLHGDLEYAEQRKCFYSYGTPKVIVSTPISQTSITIADIDTVIDTGKAIVPTAKNGVISYDEVDVSEADLKQRMKHAGRTKDGKYILCSDTPFEERIKYPVPEIQRSFLDQTVLQLASIGVNAEEMEFFHQPDIESIREAKKKLRAIGALSDANEVTEIGYKIVRIPMTTDKARMIIEAEKYGVTEQVITICAIIEMGGLLQRNKSLGSGRYYDFTTEYESDFLAELDVWNYLASRKNINFRNLGISEKNYRKIRKHIQKLYQVLDGLIEISSKNDREAIIKACLAGMHEIFVRQDYYFHVCYKGSDGVERKLDNKSCIKYDNEFLAGEPITIHSKDRWGCENSIELITFATVVPNEVILERFSDKLQEKVASVYDAQHDAVRVTTSKFYEGHFITEETKLDFAHPDYQILKNEYEERTRREEEAAHRAEEDQRLYQEMLNRRRAEEEERLRQIAGRQKYVTIDGKSFELSYSYKGEPKVYLTDADVFSIQKDKVMLDNGMEVTFKSYIVNGEYKSISGLKNAIVQHMKQQFMRNVKKKCENANIRDLAMLLEYSDMIGTYTEVENYSGIVASFEPFHVCARLKKDTVHLVIEQDEETAVADTKIVLEYLFIQEVKNRYSDSMFSHQIGKKRKVLTESEQSVKADFYSFVRECMRDITIDNANEHLEFLEEYYQELMG